MFFDSLCAGPPEAFDAFSTRKPQRRITASFLPTRPLFLNVDTADSGVALSRIHFFLIFSVVPRRVCAQVHSSYGPLKPRLSRSQMIPPPIRSVRSTSDTVTAGQLFRAGRGATLPAFMVTPSRDCAGFRRRHFHCVSAPP